jgi:hypothetical protein
VYFWIDAVLERLLMMLPCNDAKGFQDRLDGMATSSDSMSSGSPPTLTG